MIVELAFAADHEYWCPPAHRNAQHPGFPRVREIVLCPLIQPSRSLRRSRGSSGKEIECDWTATQRIAAVAQTLKVVRALASAGGRSAGQLEYHERCERQWQQRMKEFIAKHAGPTTNR